MKKPLLFIFLLVLTGFSKSTFGQSATIDSAKIKQARIIIDNCTKALDSTNISQDHKAELYALRAVNEWRIKESDKAIADYSMVISINPAFKDIYARRGATYYFLKSYQLAINDYETDLTYIKNDSLKSADIYIQVALSQRRLKQYDKSIEACSKAIILHPNFSLGYVFRGELYGLINQYQLAINDFLIGIKNYKGNDKGLSEIISECGNMRKSIRQYKEAIDDFSHAIELDPNNKLAYWHRAAGYFEDAYFELSIQDYNKAISLYEGDSTRLSKLYNERGEMEMSLKEYKKAEEDYSYSISLNKKFWEPYFNRGKVYWDNKNKNLAISDFNTVLVLDTAKKSFEYVFALYYTGNPDKAVVQLKKDLSSAKESEDITQTYYNLACLYSLLNKSDEANACLKKSFDGGYSKRFAQKDTDLDNIKNTPSFLEMIGANMVNKILTATFNSPFLPDFVLLPLR